MLMIICALVRKLNKTKNLNQRKNINSSTPTQDNQNVTHDMDNYSTAAPVRMIPPYSTVEKNGGNKDSETTFPLKQDENGTLDVSENTRGKPKVSYLELVKGEEIDKDYYENHAAHFQQNNLRDLKSKLKNSNDVGDEGINSAECPIQSELQEKRACTGRELSISCSEPNQILVIVSAYYSYYDMKDKRCYFSAGHCSTYSSREVYKKCNLQKACSFQVVEKRSSLCQTARSRYLTVLYRCRTVECPDLLPPLHGVLGFTSPARQYGSLARYTCDRGFTLAGTKTRVCQENCSWSGIQPMCSIPPEVCPTSVNPIHSYGNYCYELRPELLSYPLATQACVDSHGTLASVDTPELRAFLAWLAEDLLTGANYWVTTRQGDMQEIARSYDLTWVPATIQPTYYNMFICQYGPYNTYTPDMLDKLPNRGPGDDGTSSVSVGSYPPLNVTTGGTGQVQEDLGQDSDLVTAIVFAVLLGLLSVVLLIILAIFIRKYCKTKKEKEAEDAGDGSSWDNYSLNGGPAYRDPQTLHSTEIKNDGRNTQEEEEGDVDRECPPRAPTKKLSVQNIKALLYAQVRKIRKPRAQRDGYDDIVIQVGNSPTNENPEVPDKAPHSPVIGNPTNPITTNTVKTIALEAAAASAGIPSYANASTDSTTSGSTHEYAVPVDTKHGSPYEVRNITDMSGNQYDEVPREEDYPYQVMPNGQKSDDQVSEVAQAKKPLPIPVKRPHGQAQTDSTKVDFKDNDLYYDTSE
ncbi:uncharacterized protein LOC106179414 [Lingula anatina]|uniref:Uncharacterized protein LOC106179414 n=1 Tax=Lingula anatina TaxID=7574 RepID=A0A1S3K782_LINAN|nr:uncharacterized protein LOC106179414 [Lingula anatina]|eukprot:XP_013418490.1 uncharacterized protein LOC106179414 [Lingula anatina]